MSQPLPPEPYVRLCVLCHINGTHRPAQWVTDHTGYAACDQHRETLETRGAEAIRAAQHKTRKP